ncbi:MAG: hypothetical protein KGJ66_08910 [Alphaproteobacteria bacterium]|nr:hypothetical protein [Alphaproteobacteria bacterium]
MDRFPLARQLALPAIAVGAFAFGCAVYWLAAKSTYFAMLYSWGVVPVDYPFIDTHTVLSARVCSALGINPFFHNPCDILVRPFLYSPLFLLGAGTHELGANVPLGFALDGAFILSLLCLPTSRRLADFGVMSLAVLSSVTAFAVERGNFELLLFVMVAIAGRLALARGAAPRTLAYGLMLLAALTKYFPAVLMAVTLRERPRFFVAINAVAAVAIAAFIIGYRADLLVAYANMPRLDYFGDMFGAVTLPFGLAALIPGFPAAVALAVLAVAVLAAAVALARQPAVAQTYIELPEAERVFLAIGCLLIVGCFFAGQSIAYRGIHLLFVLPALNTLARTMPDRAGRRLFATTRTLTLVLMWREAVHHFVTLWLPAALPAWWLAKEVAWWWVIAVLASLTLCFVRHSAMGQIVARLPLPRPLLRVPLGLPGERNPS